jgi:hypothetical protein
MTTMVAGAPATTPGWSLRRHGFGLLLAYYWLMQFVPVSGGTVERGSVVFYMTVVPVALFVCIALASLGARIRLDLPSGFVAAYLVLVCVVAASRADLSTMLTVGLLSGTMITVLLMRPGLNTSALNAAFLLSIPLSIGLFFSGRSIYAVVPGMSVGRELWRVSLFPFIAPSAYFALVVFLMNVVRRDGLLRRTTLLLSAYFLIFSQTRSAWMAGGFALALVLAGRFGWLRSARARVWYVVGATVAFVLSLVAGPLLAFVPALSSGWIGRYVFRLSGGNASPEEISASIFRTWIWTEHGRLFWSQPLVGVGTFDFMASARFDPLFLQETSGSESFLTGIFARVGLLALLFFAGIFAAMTRALRTGDSLPALMAIVLFVAMLAYGSFLNAYDFVFLCIFIPLVSTANARAEGQPGPGPR